MRFSMRVVMVTLWLGLGWTPPVRSEGTITDGAATFTTTAPHFDATPAANFSGVAPTLGQDHVFETGWFYRVAGDTAEKAFPAPTTEAYVGAVATLGWTDVDARGFAASETDTIINDGGPSGRVILALTITNSSAQNTLDLTMFHMVDFDLQPTAGNDVVAVPGSNDVLHVTDAGTNTAAYAGVGAAAYLVRAFNSTTDVAGLLSDAGLTTFDNTGTPFGPGDMTAGFMWQQVSIPPQGATTFVAILAVNTSATLPTTTTTTSSTTTSTTIATTSTTSSTTTTSTTTSSTSSTLVVVTTSTSMPAGTTTTTTGGATPELCDNCLDDDADGLVDLEDGDCCADPAALTIKRASFRPVEDNAKVRLTATIDAVGLTEGTPPAQDLSLVLRHEVDGLVLCARMPASSLTRSKARMLFRDPSRAVTTAQGVSVATLVQKKNGSGKLVAATGAVVAVPAPGTMTLTMGLRAPATAESGNRCAIGAATFRQTPAGVLKTP